MTRRMLRCLVCVSCLLGPLALSAHGETIQVTTVSDAIGEDGRCTLREAVIAANTDAPVNECPAGSGADTVELAFGSTFVLSIAGAGEDSGLTGDLDVRDDLTIRPANPGEMPVIDAMGIDRVFDVINGADLTLDQIEVRGGDVMGFGGGIFVRAAISKLEMVSSILANNRSSNFGGGIFSRGTVRLHRSSVLFNEGSAGGGVYLSNSNSLRMVDSAVRGNLAASDGAGLSVQVLQAQNSNISGNEADRHGGGIHWRPVSVMVDPSHLTNTTVAENKSGEDGGGFYVEGPVTVELSNTTVAWNSSDIDQNGSGDGGGVVVADGTVRSRNSIVAANQDLSPASGAPDCVGQIESQGHNLFASIDGATCVLTGITTGNLVGTLGNPVIHELDCLTFNGGPTRSVLPMPSSPVIDAGDAAGCAAPTGGLLNVDQRGHTRPWDGPDGNPGLRCDMGSVEVDAPVFDRVFDDGFESGDTTAWVENGASPLFKHSWMLVAGADRRAALDDDRRHLKGGGCDPK